MSRFSERLEQDLSHIADRATPSPTAWEAIQSRIAEQADEPEMEIIMLDQNRQEPSLNVREWLLAAAAALIVIVGGGIALTQLLRDGDSLDVTGPATTEVPTTFSTTTVTEPPATQPPTTADGATIDIAESYIAARNSYDGSAARALFADDASYRDDLQRDVNGVFRGFDEIDFDFNAEFERVTGVVHADVECSAGSPGRVRCTYTWESAWSRALGDDRYTGNSFLFDIADGQIEGLTHTFAQGPVDGFENHISEVQVRWLQINHPDDVSTMFDSDGFIANSAESLALWESYTQEFVAATSAADG